MFRGAGWAGVEVAACGLGDSTTGSVAGELLITLTSQWNDDDGGASPILAANSAAKKTAVPCRQSETIHPLARKRTKGFGVSEWRAVTGARLPD